VSTNKPPLIGFLYDDNIPEKLIDEAAIALETETIAIAKIKRPAGAIYLTLEWLVPTVVVGYIAKAYFEAVIGKLGEDHYEKVKLAFSSLFSKVSSSKVTVIGSKGKASPANPFNMLFSIEAEAIPSLQFKLLIHKNLNPDEITLATDAFLSFVRAFHCDELSQETLVELEKYGAKGSRILICFEHDAGQLRLVDIAESREQAISHVYLSI
jgi:hypothetical protein